MLLEKPLKKTKNSHQETKMFIGTQAAIHYVKGETAVIAA